jgi:hypothetical protein
MIPCVWFNPLSMGLPDPRSSFLILLQGRRTKKSGPPKPTCRSREMFGSYSGQWPAEGLHKYNEVSKVDHRIIVQVEQCVSRVVCLDKQYEISKSYLPVIIEVCARVGMDHSGRPRYRDLNSF